MLSFEQRSRDHAARMLSLASVIDTNLKIHNKQARRSHIRWWDAINTKMSAAFVSTDDELCAILRIFDMK
jgi:hypothetical protein